MGRKTLLKTLILAACIALAGCGTVKEASVENAQAEIQTKTGDNLYKTDKTDKSGKSDRETQISLIAASADMFSGYDEGAGYKYAATDLDRNGRLEIICASQQGSGFYTYADFYEVNEKRDKLEKCRYNAADGDSQPDIISQSARYCEKDGRICYFFDDDIRAGADYFYVLKDALWLKNGEVSFSGCAVCSNENGRIVYLNGKNEEVYKEEYDALCEYPFGEDAEYKTAYFEWYELNDGISEENLKQSYMTFLNEEKDEKDEEKDCREQS